MTYQAFFEKWETDKSIANFAECMENVCLNILVRDDVDQSKVIEGQAATSFVVEQGQLAKLGHSIQQNGDRQIREL